MKNEISSFTFTAIQTALQAGELLKRGFGTSYDINSKEGKHNLVTEYDKLSENLIISHISKEFPDHAFLAEESGKSKNHDKTVLWIIDPLDGTVNFAHQIPFFSISIAAYYEKKILTGVVYQPMTNELFIGELNKGSYLNGRRLKVSKTNRIEESILATGFPYNVHENPLCCIDQFAKLTKKGVPIRRLGSAALDLCYVAAGRFDAYWEVSLHPWDVAAGQLIVEEALGKVSNYKGKPRDLLSTDSILASNSFLHEEMINSLKI